LGITFNASFMAPISVIYGKSISTWLKYEKRYVPDWSIKKMLKVKAILVNLLKANSECVLDSL
jgi:hypothetical protein